MSQKICKHGHTHIWRWHSRGQINLDSFWEFWFTYLPFCGKSPHWSNRASSLLLMLSSLPSASSYAIMWITSPCFHCEEDSCTQKHENSSINPTWRIRSPEQSSPKPKQKVTVKFCSFSLKGVGVPIHVTSEETWNRQFYQPTLLTACSHICSLQPLAHTFCYSLPPKQVSINIIQPQITYLILGLHHTSCPSFIGPARPASGVSHFILPSKLKLLSCHVVWQLEDEETQEKSVAVSGKRVPLDY